MQYFLDRYERFRRGDDGTVKMWTNGGFDDLKCSGLVRADGKILSSINCKMDPSDSSNYVKGIIVYNKDGPYLIEPYKSFSFTSEINDALPKPWDKK